MALIKGNKFRLPDDDSEKDGKPEEQVRRGGLIKGKEVRGKVSSELIDESQPTALKKKIFKTGRSTSVMKSTDLFDHDFSDGESDEKPADSGFLRTSFLIKSGVIDGKSAGKVIRVPSNENEAARYGADDSQDDYRRQEYNDYDGSTETGHTSSDFKIEEPAQMQRVDVEAMIAEAEHKGREKAEKIIEHAQAEAKNLIDQAKIYGETVKKEAHQEGIRQGKEDGYQAAQAEFAAMMEEAKNLFTQLVRERNKVLASLEPELARLSLDICKKIIGQEIKTNPDMVISIISQAMGSMKSQEKVTLKVHPDDLEHVEANKDVFLRLVEGIRELGIVSDARVDRGGCLIETDLGTTDARISTQLTAIEQAFKDVDEAIKAQLG